VRDGAIFLKSYPVAQQHAVQAVENTKPVSQRTVEVERAGQKFRMRKPARKPPTESLNPESPEVFAALKATAEAATVEQTKSSARTMERLHDALRAGGQTRTELIDKALRVEDVIRWLEKASESDGLKVHEASAAKHPAETGEAPSSGPRAIADMPQEVWARVKAGEKISAREAVKLAKGGL
jgi:hypothetical protein